MNFYTLISDTSKQHDNQFILPVNYAVYNEGNSVSTELKTIESQLMPTNINDEYQDTESNPLVENNESSPIKTDGLKMHSSISPFISSISTSSFNQCNENLNHNYYSNAAVPENTNFQNDSDKFKRSRGHNDGSVSPSEISPSKKKFKQNDDLISGSENQDSNNNKSDSKSKEEIENLIQLSCEICNNVEIYKPQNRNRCRYGCGSMVFQCKVCNLYYDDYREIYKHTVQWHYGTKCIHCQTEFENTTQLHSHYFFHCKLHNYKSSVECYCVKCEKIVSESQDTRCSDCHLALQPKCIDCGIVHVTEMDMLKHLAECGKGRKLTINSKTNCEPKTDSPKVPRKKNKVDDQRRGTSDASSNVALGSQGVPNGSQQSYPVQPYNMPNYPNALPLLPHYDVQSYQNVLASAYFLMQNYHYEQMMRGNMNSPFNPYNPYSHQPPLNYPNYPLPNLPYYNAQTPASNAGTSSTKTYSCPKCKKIFSDRPSMDKHRVRECQSQTPGSGVVIDAYCSMCNVAFDYSGGKLSQTCSKCRYNLIFTCKSCESIYIDPLHAKHHVEKPTCI